jgi:hypothetical protein
MYGNLILGFKMASANICRAAAEDARHLRSDVYGKDKLPKYTTRLRFTPIGGGLSENSPIYYNHILKSRFKHTDDAEFESTIQDGFQINAFRKAIQAQYEIGVTAHQEQEIMPDLDLQVVRDLLDEHITNPDLHAIFKNFLDGSVYGVTDTACEMAVRAILLEPEPSHPRL